MTQNWSNCRYARVLFSIKLSKKSKTSSWTRYNYMICEKPTHNWYNEYQYISREQIEFLSQVDCFKFGVVERSQPPTPHLINVGVFLLKIICVCMCNMCKINFNFKLGIGSVDGFLDLLVGWIAFQSSETIFVVSFVHAIDDHRPTQINYRFVSSFLFRSNVNRLFFKTFFLLLLLHRGEGWIENRVYNKKSISRKRKSWKEIQCLLISQNKKEHRIWKPRPSWQGFLKINNRCQSNCYFYFRIVSFWFPGLLINDNLKMVENKIKTH